MKQSQKKKNKKLLKQYREKADFEIDKATKDRQEKADKAIEEQRKKDEAEEKRREEKRKQERENYKKNFDAIQQVIDEANKKKTEANSNDREKELIEVRYTYAERLKIVQKAYDDTIKKTKELLLKKKEAEKILLESEKEQEIEIEKKYHQKIIDFLNEKNVTEYEKKRDEIVKKYDDLIKVASDADKKLLEISKGTELGNLDKEQTQKINVVKSETSLIRSERVNTPTENDSPETARQKILDLTSAKIEAENEAYLLKKIQLDGQNEELEKAEEEHQSNLANIQKQYSETRKNIDKAETESKLSMYTTIGNSATQLGDLLGKQTVAGKALAIAGIIAQQASSIGKIVMSTQEANAKAMAASPLTAGMPWVAVNTASGIISGAATVAAGAKAIAALGGSGGASNSNISSQINSGVAAPSISSTATTEQQIQNVRITNQEQLPIRAYITNNDLQTNQQKVNFLNNISTI